eukprot:1159140-Pelagomonas_calceolata.AAC.7
MSRPMPAIFEAIIAVVDAIDRPKEALAMFQPGPGAMHATKLVLLVAFAFHHWFGKYRCKQSSDVLDACGQQGVSMSTVASPYCKT